MKKKMLLTCITVLSTLILTASMLLNSYAATENDKKELQEKINQATDELNQISDNKDDAQSELESLTNQVTDVQNEIASLEAQLSDLNSSIEVKEKEIKEQEAQIEEKDELLRKRLVALYKLGDTSYLDVLFNSEDLFDFLSIYTMIKKIAEADTNLISELEQQKKELENDKIELENSKQKVEELKANQEIKRAQLQTLQENKKAEVNKL